MARIVRACVLAVVVSLPPAASGFQFLSKFKSPVKIDTGAAAKVKDRFGDKSEI